MIISIAACASYLFLLNRTGNACSKFMSSLSHRVYCIILAKALLQQQQRTSGGKAIEEAEEDEFRYVELARKLASQPGAIQPNIL